MSQLSSWAEKEQILLTSNVLFLLTLSVLAEAYPWGRAICFTQPNDSNSNRMWQHPHRYTQNNSWSNTWASHDSVKLTCNINHIISILGPLIENIDYCWGTKGICLKGPWSSFCWLHIYGKVAVVPQTYIFLANWHLDPEAWWNSCLIL